MHCHTAWPFHINSKSPPRYFATAAQSSWFFSLQFQVQCEGSCRCWQMSSDSEAAGPTDLWSTGQTPAATSFPLAAQLLITQVLRCHTSLFLLTLSARKDIIAVAVFHWLKRCISQLFFQGRRAFAAASCAAVTPKDHISILWKTQHHSWCPAPGGLHPDTGINSKWQLCHAKVYNLDVHGAVGGRPLHNQVWGLCDRFQKSSGRRGLGQLREGVSPLLPSRRFSGDWVVVTLMTPLGWRWQSQTA